MGPKEITIDGVFSSQAFHKNLEVFKVGTLELRLDQSERRLSTLYSIK
jgi:hypothetical protein